MELLHGRVSIELHTLKSGAGQPLLLLHALGSSTKAWSNTAACWADGPVFGIDFSGHGDSGWVRGGAYCPEYFLADADLALAEIGEPCVLVGAGIGAYVALLLAGSRVDSVLGALLLDGAGLFGCGSSPDDEMKFDDIEGFESFVSEASAHFDRGTDPMVAQCDRDMRPVDYVESFAKAAKPVLLSDRVGRDGRDGKAPAWWEVARQANGGADLDGDLSARLGEFALKIVK